MNERASLFQRLLRYGSIPAAAVVVALVIWKMGGEDEAPERSAPASASTPRAQAGTPVPALPTAEAAPAPESRPTEAEMQAASKPFATFERRPFPVAQESGTHEWTAEDGRSPEVIADIAHNELEAQRLMEENSRIRRRQLVYRKEPVHMLVERARATGEPVRKFTLPAFDGRELEVEVTEANLEPSGLRGTFTGRLPGREQSLVTLSFSQGREAFTVVSPEDGTFLQGHPREPGEIIVTSFNPDTYLNLPGGEPIRTSETFKPFQ